MSWTLRSYAPPLRHQFPDQFAALFQKRLQLRRRLSVPFPLRCFRAQHRNAHINLDQRLGWHAVPILMTGAPLAIRTNTESHFLFSIYLHALIKQSDAMKRRFLAFLKTPGGAFVCAVFLTYFPFSWILLIHENRDAWLKLWPTLPGLIVGYLLSALYHFRKIDSLSLVLSLALPCVVFFLMLQFKSRRLLISSLAMAFFCALSFVAYLLYLS